MQTESCKHFLPRLWLFVCCWWQLETSICSLYVESSHYSGWVWYNQLSQCLPSFPRAWTCLLWGTLPKSLFIRLSNRIETFFERMWTFQWKSWWRFVWLVIEFSEYDTVCLFTWSWICSLVNNIWICPVPHVNSWNRAKSGLIPNLYVNVCTSKMKFVFVILALGELTTQALFRGNVTGKYFHKNFKYYVIIEILCIMYGI